jgi:hypothetical protein
MSQFGVYNEVLPKMDIKDKSVFLNNTHAATINKLSAEHRDNIFLLIYHHYVKTTGRTEYPYGIRVGTKGKGIHCDVSKFPQDLQAIIVKYIALITE